MNTLTKLVLIAALILSVLIPFGYYRRKESVFMGWSSPL